MGYGNTQKGEGIHFRQRARAFVIDDGIKHVAFVSMDMGMGSDILTKRVVEELQGRLGDGVYTYDNVCLSGTHTHSGPGGFLQYVMVEIPTLGFVEETMKPLVAGIVSAIMKAHKSLQPGTIKMANGKLFGSNINRSPTSYLLNPQAERDEYADEGDTDKNMLLLRFDSADGKPLGMLNWFAVHGTSMNNTNHLLSGDNRGYASYLFERHMNGKEVPTGQGEFVAAFASTNLGDVSPNTNGARCTDTGLPCDKLHSTCNGKEMLCVASGPGKDMFESTKIIGNKQHQHALKLYAEATTEITGSVDYRHSFVGFENLEVTLEDGSTAQTCPAALGYAFAAGTTDG
jgi:neutral ceramidase